MAIRKLYIGSFGPFPYDDTDPVNDPDFPGETRKAILTSGKVKAEDGVATVEAHASTHENGGSDVINDLASPNIASGDLSHGGTKVIGTQQAAEANASAVSSISLGSGADQVDRATFNTDLGTLVTEINALKTKINNLLAKLRTHGIIAT